MDKNYDYIDEMIFAKSAVKTACAVDYGYVDGHVEIVRDYEQKDGPGKKTVEKNIVGYLKGIYPDDDFIILPSENISLKKRTWVIETVRRRKSDIIEAVRCSLFANGTCVMSVLYLTYTDEMFTVTEDGHLFLNERLLEADANICKEDVALRLAYADAENEKEKSLARNAFTRLEKKCSEISLGKCSCVDFANLVTGRTDGLILVGGESVLTSLGELICGRGRCSNMQTSINGISVRVFASDRRTFDMLVDTLNVTG